MRHFLLVIGLLLACGCGDNHGAKPNAPDASPPVDAPGEQAVGPCLDGPTDLPRPPTATLPCELYPPQ